MAEKCQCELCKMYPIYEREKENWNETTKWLFNELYGMMTEASMDRCYLRSKYVDKTWPSNDENILAGVH